MKRSPIFIIAATVIFAECSLAREGKLPLQFRPGENEPGRIPGIVVDGKPIMAPVIRTSITGGKAFIMGNLNNKPKQ